MTDPVLPKRRPPVPLRLSEELLAKAELIKDRRGEVKRHAILVEAVERGLEEMLLTTPLSQLPEGRAFINSEEWPIRNGVARKPKASLGRSDVSPNLKR